MSYDPHILDAILVALDRSEITTKEDFHKLKNTILADHALAVGPSHIALIERYEMLVRTSQIRDDLRIRKVLRKRAVRSLSGVAVVSLLTRFHGCPGKCIYCPSYAGLPKSYISDEPAVQRAELHAFDPFRQVENRLESLSLTGNAISKCDVRIIGGTWSVYPHAYQEDFIKNIYDAHTLFSRKTRVLSDDIFPENIFAKNPEKSENNKNPAKFFTKKSSEKNQNFLADQSPDLETAKTRNETAESRVIGIAIETRPDWINIDEIIRLRRYGVTRVEIGYQTTHDAINRLNQRGHGNRESIDATRLLKDAGFKVVAHMMPGLMGSTPDMDRSSMNEIFDSADYRPDELKIYPLVVTPHSELEQIWRRGEFEPYDDATLVPLMADLQAMIPEYVRLNRMYRDIPAHEILAGSRIANLRQVTEIMMRSRGLARHDISAREIRAKSNDPDRAIIDVIEYDASGGREYFIQMIDGDDRTIFGLCRLRIPSQIFEGKIHFIEALDGAAIIRELHVFGDQIPVGLASDHTGQHQGFGKKMLREAEKIVLEKYSDIHKIAVIAGVGVREYYEKRGYHRDGEYMSKFL